jgi:hypothetical protein
MASWPLRQNSTHQARAVLLRLELVKKHGVLARLGQGYPFAKLQSNLENSRISIVAPQSANSFLLTLFSELKGDTPPIQLIVA